MDSIKQLMLNSLLLPGFPALLRHVERDCATIFMLHRFRDAERGIAGCEIAQLRLALAYLARNNYELVALTDLFERLGGNGPQACGAVAFTIDDGYVDQAAVAAPVFAEFGCPVTTFVTTGFLDGKLWFWWDQIEFVFRQTTRRSIEVRVGDVVLEYHWENEDQRIRAQTEFTASCKRVPETERIAAIAQLAQASDVEVPRNPPAQFAPMSWDQVRKCEKLGMTFGPHSVSHPVLSRTTHDATMYEITESWARLRAEARHPVPIFCYPNGEWGDFGDREIAALRGLGFIGAVVAEPGYANARSFRGEKDNAFRVQRFGFPDDLPHMVQYVSGVERLKQVLRANATFQGPG
jgi:peptidoglycan/xylan/chitin deacetylase (PgdA/CDA1 family)